MLQVQVDFAKLTFHLKKLKNGIRKSKAANKELKYQLKEMKSD